MITKEVRKLRGDVAKHRFYVYHIRSTGHGLQEKYPHIVCDNAKESGKKPIARFKEKKHAELFLRLVKALFVKGELE